MIEKARKWEEGRQRVLQADTYQLMREQKEIQLKARGVRSELEASKVKPIKKLVDR